MVRTTPEMIAITEGGERKVAEAAPAMIGAAKGTMIMIMIMVMIMVMTTMTITTITTSRPVTVVEP